LINTCSDQRASQRARRHRHQRTQAKEQKERFCTEKGSIMTAVMIINNQREIEQATQH